MLPRATPDEAHGVAAQLLETVRQDLSMARDERFRGVTASVGLASFERGVDLVAEELIAEATMAMYDAKDAGRDRLVVHDRAGSTQTRTPAGGPLVDRIRAALSEESLVLHAQPIASLRGNGAPRYELLVRLRGEHGDLIRPGAFLDLAERWDLVQQIDAGVVSQACRLLAESQGVAPGTVFEVNLSGKSVADPSFLGLIESELEAASVEPRGLCLEVTETAAILNLERLRSFAAAASALGCEFALDDFGADFASFYRFKDLAVDLLKIDGELIKDLPVNSTNQLITRAIVDVARELGKRTIAESAEDAETVALLREYGVDYAQGYYVGKPIPVHALELAPRRVLAHAGRSRGRARPQPPEVRPAGSRQAYGRPDPFAPVRTGARLSLPSTPRAALAARQAVGALEPYIPGERLHDLLLLVTEAVGNAVRHPQDDRLSFVGLQVLIYDDRIRVEVRDRGNGFRPPPPPGYGEERPSGWGLYLIGDVANRWGIDRDRGTVVWFELDTPAAAGRVPEPL